jgi:hypothetical protein
MNATQNITRRLSRVLVVAGMSALAFVAITPAHAQAPAAPGSMVDYRSKVGQSFDFTVKASLGGSVWGTDIYTDDSGLSAAVIHAGLLRDGQQGVIRVTMLAGQSSYQGSTRNGVTSSGYGSWYGSYRVAAVSTGTTTTTTTTATGSFHAMWATDWAGVYLGIVQTGNQATGYIWLGDWYEVFTGTVTGRVLEGRWDAYFVGGTLTCTLAPDGRGFDAVVKASDGTVLGTIKAGLYSLWP